MYQFFVFSLLPVLLALPPPWGIAIAHQLRAHASKMVAAAEISSIRFPPLHYTRHDNLHSLAHDHGTCKPTSHLAQAPNLFQTDARATRRGLDSHGTTKTDRKFIYCCTVPRSKCFSPSLQQPLSLIIDLERLELGPRLCQSNSGTRDAAMAPPPPPSRGLEIQLNPDEKWK